MIRQRFTVVCFILLMLLSGAIHAGNGESLFKSRCLQCHKNGVNTFSGSLDAIKQVLATGSVRKHRFSLSEAEIEAVMAYIATAKGQ